MGGGHTPPLFMDTISIDFETRSTTDLTKSGVYRYVEDPNTDVLCMAWAIGDDEPELWVPGDLPLVFVGSQYRAWNADFERTVWNSIMVDRYGALPVPNELWVCTQAEALALSLPASLDKAAKVLDSEYKKDAAGHRLMLQMCKPRPPRKDEDPDGLYWWDDPDRRQRLGEYCRQDVRTERAIAKQVRRLDEAERRVFYLDMAINDRGVRVDMELVGALDKIVEEAMARGAIRLGEVTGGAVLTTTNPRGMLRWINDRPTLELPDLTKATVRDLLLCDILPDGVREVLRIRADTGKTSVSKLKSFTAAVNKGGRVKGMLQYHGANTGRWSGRLTQPQNFPKGSIDDVESFIPLVMAGEYEAIAEQAPPMEVVSSLLRACFVASPGHRFMSGDYSQIEARVLAWLAGQDDLCSAFRNSEPVYEQMAAVIFHRPVHEIENPSYERNVGKAAILGAGFQMGWRKFIDQVSKTTGLLLPESLASETITAYRSTYDKIPTLWTDMNAAAIAAVRSPKTKQVVNDKIAYYMKGQYLWCILPSKRALAYALPQVVGRPTPWGEIRPCVEVCRENSVTRKWERAALYGGLLTENAVQAIARDLMAEAMLRVEAAGYPVVLTVHDEILSDVSQEGGNLEAFVGLMKEVPRWAEDIPVAVSGWEGQRYRKD